jgi:hypothetical protein
MSNTAILPGMALGRRKPTTSPHGPTQTANRRPRVTRAALVAKQLEHLGAIGEAKPAEADLSPASIAPIVAGVVRSTGARRRQAHCPAVGALLRQQKR